MRVFTIILLAFLNTSQALAEEIYLFEDSKAFDYSVTVEDIVPGYSARMVKNGFLLGKAKNKRKPLDMNKPIGEIFEETIEGNKKETELLVDSEKAVTEKLENLDDSFGIVEEGEDSIGQTSTEVVIKWESVDQCARETLPILKKAVYLESKGPEDEIYQKHYEVVLTLLKARSSDDDFVCGMYLNPQVKMNLSNHIDNIKVLSAILSRPSKREKKQLYETLVGAYGIHAPEKSRMLYVYMWAKISFMAVTGAEYLPSPLKVVQEIKNSPDVITSDMVVDGEKVPYQVTLSYDDLSDQLKIGRQYIDQWQVQYE